MLTSVKTSRRQGQHREELSEGSPSAKRRADEQEPDIRLSRRAEWAHDHEDHEFARQSKSGGCAVADIAGANICPSDNTSRYCPCHWLVVIVVNMINDEFSNRGLSPHQFMPMLGVHPAFKRDAAKARRPLTLRWASKPNRSRA